ncbi:T9SS type A sorting domain-containing protein [Salmonirosea aquatica]|uniref:T9SS type A sorting domain-containing protein n=1 Tax=Salmonirosea aquatica TaxID=2654236 RepID=A0A7C9FC20_9BACT|nr:T9SS type A sorting domain-containing protein [Cytophagaceae bacterium SJW1-29]
MKNISLLLVMIVLNLGIRSQTSAQTFNSTGANQSYTINATGTLTITSRGADGASAFANGGSGATVQADFPVQMNDELIIVVGKAGIGNLSGQGFGGGGGGSAVILKRGGTSTLLIVSGGGGGSSLLNSDGRGGLASDGTPGGGNVLGTQYIKGGTGGGGFGVDGSSISAFNTVLYSGGQAGTLSGGGNGGTSPIGPSGGFGFGGGGSGNNLTFSGGGGGGYGGGNGGFGSIGVPNIGGSGGTSFIQTSGIAGTNAVRTNGVNGGGSGQDGSVILNFVCGAPAPNLFTAYPGDVRVPAGQQSANVCQNSGDVIFQFDNCIGGTVNWMGSDNSSGTGNIVATSANVGTVTYSATCTLEGCTGETSTVSVTTKAPPAVTISGNTSVIYGYGSNCTTLTASATGGTTPYTYSWSPGGSTNASINVCPTSTTTYTVTVTGANGCSTQKSVEVNVNDVRCGYGGVKMCLGGRELCLAQYLVPTYLRFGATLGGCNSNVPARISYEGETSEAVLTLSMKAYPNPTANALTVEVSSVVAGAAQLDVLDVAGRPVQQRVQELSEGVNRVEFNLGRQAQGTYLIRCRDALGRQAVVRVQKQ